MGFLRRLFGRDIKTDTAVQNGYTLVADDTKTSGLDWSDVLIRGGLGRDLVTGINRLAGNSYDLDTVFLPGEYYFDIDTLGDRPCNYGLLKVWRESSAVVYQIVQSSDEANNRMFSRCYRNSSWGPWTEYASTSNMPSLSGYATEEYVNNAVANTSGHALVKLTGSGNFTVPAGVTSLKVTIVSGGMAKFYWTQGSHGQFNGCVYINKIPGVERTIEMSATPGDSISYNCGVGQGLSVISPNLPSFGYILETPAQNSYFGTYFCEPPVGRFSVYHTKIYWGFGVIGNPANSGYHYSVAPAGRLPKGLVANSASYPFTSPPYIPFGIYIDDTNGNNSGIVPAALIVSNTPTSLTNFQPLEPDEVLELYLPDSNIETESGDPGYIIVEYSQ